MYPVLFWVGGKPVITWTVSTLVGVWAAFFSLGSSLRAARIPRWQVIVFFLGCVIVFFSGAIVGQVVTVGLTALSVGAEHIELAGFVLYGGVLATMAYGLVAWLALGWRRKLLVRELWDAGSLALAWALVFARIGCTLYGCCYGTPAGAWPGYMLNEARWDRINHRFPAELRGVKLHPATLYEALGLLAIVGLLSWMRRQNARAPGRFPPGVQGWACWIPYGVLRFSLEFIRGDDRGAGYWGLSPSQLIAVATVTVGIIMVQDDWRRKRKPLSAAAIS